MNPDITLHDGPNGTKVVSGIDRVDLWVGGLAEKHINGGMVGQTFWVVLHEQFDRLQEGDRLYYLDRFDNFDFYQNNVEGQTFADIVRPQHRPDGVVRGYLHVGTEDGQAAGGDGRRCRRRCGRNLRPWDRHRGRGNRGRFHPGAPQPDRAAGTIRHLATAAPEQAPPVGPRVGTAATRKPAAAATSAAPATAATAG